MRSDKGLFALVGGKKIKNKISYLARIGGKNKKDALKLFFTMKIDTFPMIYPLFK